MITLIQFFPVWNIPNASPFCLKLETYLRMVKLPYQNKYTANPRVSPTGKFPVIEDQGKLIADSSLIIDYLKTAYGDKLDQTLTAHQKALALTTQRLIEEHLYWVLVYFRWLDPQNWPFLKQAYFGKLPLFLKFWLPNVIRKKIIRQIQGHGLGLHRAKTIYEFGKKDLQALADLLGEQAFFLGDKPTSLDACAYATLANIYYVPIEGLLKDYANQFKNLKEYCDRMQQLYYSSST
ncbi:MAG: glutathione S-transferase [Gammaproteobacteria bacterium RIFCSPHIGHO2_12_FULL_35_23]|nr:MAG: glutathione S-transferase [Gammaproteobacteria bacterium RIFCSPHIGHO2_12_FULL_35_23]